MRLKPFFSFYGSKYRAAPRYPEPACNVIVEPFAGSAGYSVYHHTRDVRLFDIDPVIVGVWDYLIRVPRSTFMRLPGWVERVSDLKCSQEAKWLIGFWMNAACTAPRDTPSSWARQKRSIPFWCEDMRERIASQLKYIRHWRVKHRAWDRLPGLKATWFIDPPYQNKCGREYIFNEIDFEALGNWCRDRRKQVIVCEQAGADWLPFEPFASFKSTPGKNKSKRSEEVIWHHG